ncbi:MAG: Isoleucyl-tRNA synthetase, partial [uncultured Thermoleophilia bacterium]
VHLPPRRREARPSRARARDPGALGAGRHVRAPARAEPRRGAVLVRRRADHGQQPHGRAPRVGPLAEGPVPALQGRTGPRAPLPERLRLPGAVGRGRGREGARPELEARDRGVRPGPVRRGVSRPGRRVRGRPDAAVDPARPVDGLGPVLLHVHRPEHRLHLALPQGVRAAGLAVQRAPADGVVPA